MEIVDLLERQHDVSRELNREILGISGKGEGATQDELVRMLELCGMFVEMYLPHISRENTIVFPAFFDIVSARYLDDIKEKMEDKEEKVLGKTGFRGLVGRLSEIEKEVGTYDLSQYTARLH